MSTDSLPPTSPRRRARRARLGLRAALVLGLVAALGAGCAEDPPAAAAGDPAPDAGPPCESGSQGCVCGSGCDDNLLCVADRCVLTEGPREPAPPPTPRPRPTRPPLQGADAGPSPDAAAPGGPPQAEPADAGRGDAGAPDASA